MPPQPITTILRRRPFASSRHRLPSPTPCLPSPTPCLPSPSSISGANYNSCKSFISRGLCTQGPCMIVMTSWPLFGCAFMLGQSNA
ncbi:hypothetical protein LOK49_LG01G03615 [Camellia lanceoleosa]|uniref:Uncharacterized protein n=1 Tax=Camellia lanceoleosa TaxID=1840588 RepID=A0ACC0IV82_9ERIC|nr:hypothetical protein LOK49_LG01G03615 [Camellia lanceoleosa]